MPRMRYVGPNDIMLLRLNGEEVPLSPGDEIDLTDEEAAGCACRPEHPHGIWERVERGGFMPSVLTIPMAADEE